jgi:hypothetical protein
MIIMLLQVVNPLIIEALLKQIPIPAPNQNKQNTTSNTTCIFSTPVWEPSNDTTSGTVYVPTYPPQPMYPVSPSRPMPPALNLDQVEVAVSTEEVTGVDPHGITWRLWGPDEDNATVFAWNATAEEVQAAARNHTGGVAVTVARRR